MQLGMLGLGQMGSSMVRRLMRYGHECVVYDLDPELGAPLSADGASVATSLEDVVNQLTPRRVIWIMLPAGRSSG